MWRFGTRHVKARVSECQVVSEVKYEPSATVSSLQSDLPEASRLQPFCAKKKLKAGLSQVSQTEFLSTHHCLAYPFEPPAMACREPMWGSRWVVVFGFVSHFDFIAWVPFSLSFVTLLNIPFGRSGASHSKRQRVEEPAANYAGPGQTSQLGIVRTIGINQIRSLVFICCAVSLVPFFCYFACRPFSRIIGWSMEPESLRDGMAKSFSTAISVHWVSLCSLVVLTLSSEVGLELAISRMARNSLWGMSGRLPIDFVTSMAQFADRPFVVLLFQKKFRSIKSWASRHFQVHFHRSIWILGQ